MKDEAKVKSDESEGRRVKSTAGTRGPRVSATNTFGVTVLQLCTHPAPSALRVQGFTMARRGQIKGRLLCFLGSAVHLFPTFNKQPRHYGGRVNKAAVRKA